MLIEGFQNLTAAARAAACAELQADLLAGQAFKSRRVREEKMDLYFRLLSESLADHDDLWLVERLRALDCIVRPKYWTKTGKYQTTPKNAEEVLGRGEFKRYIARGICLDAMANGVSHVQYYRAYESWIHREESDLLIGTTITPEVLLTLARTLTDDGEPYAGPPCEFGSGLCVRVSTALSA